MEKTNVIPASGRAFKGAAFSTLSASKPRLHTASSFPTELGINIENFQKQTSLQTVKNLTSRSKVILSQKPDPMSIMALRDASASKNMRLWSPPFLGKPGLQFTTSATARILFNFLLENRLTHKSAASKIFIDFNYCTFFQIIFRLKMFKCLGRFN